MSQLDYRFVEQARRDLTALLASHPELEQDDVLCLDMIEGTTNALELLDKLIAAERNAFALSAAIDTEFERLRERQNRFEARRTTIRKHIMHLMEAANLKKAERPAATVSIAAGRSKVIITDETKLGDFYMRVKKEPDKEKIAQAFKEGMPVPGATLSNAEPVLRIS
jgi:hypothetical protein